MIPRRTALLLAVAALFLRTCALSHGLHQGERYHPDVSKQVDATARFLGGDYLMIFGERNYDGYPLFNSHLVEYLVRVVDPPLRAAYRHVGVTGRETPAAVPREATLHWVTLLWNALLSAAAVGIAALIGRRFGAAAGMTAGILALLSPLDISAAHYAANDTAAAFFALVAVYLAVRILEAGAMRHYVLGALAVAAAFSSKYHGAEAAVALAAAHLLRYPGRAVLLSRGAWLRVGAAAVAGTAGVVLTSPALLVNPQWTLSSIPRFISFVSTYNLPPEILGMPRHELLLMGLSDNLSILARSMGVLSAVGIAAALAVGRPRKVIWVVAALPVTHLLLASAMKPVSHPVHHLPVIIPFLVLTGAGYAAIIAPGRPLALRAAGAICAAGAVLWLGSAARDELFFFGRGDTRRIAATYAMDAIPASVAVAVTPYTFTLPPSPPGSRGDTVVTFLSPRHPRGLAPGEFQLTRFALEENALPIFRNPEIKVLVKGQRLLAPGFDLPLWSPIPSTRPDDLAFLDAPFFYRSPLVRDVTDDAPFSVTVASRHPLDRAWLVVRAWDGPASLRLGLGGRAVERGLGSGELAVIPLEGLRRLRPPFEGNHFYEWTARARFGRARISLVTDGAQVGRFCFNTGLYREAWEAFSSAGDASAGAGERLERAIAGRASGALSAEGAAGLVSDLLAVDEWDRDGVARRFGVHPDWLDGLPFVAFDEGDFLPDDAPRGRAPATADLHTRSFHLEPGRYRLRISGDRWRGFVRARWLDPCGRIAAPLDPAPLPGEAPSEGCSGSLEATLVVDPGQTFGSLKLMPAEGAMPPTGLSVTIRPDVVGSVKERVRILRRLLGEKVPGDPSPRVIGPPLAELAGGRARFEEGFELLSVRLDPSDLLPGGSVGLRMEWRIGIDAIPPERVGVWLHVMDGGGRRVFQGDHSILDDVRCPAKDDRLEPCLYRFPIPPDIEPGTYDLRAGLWLPTRRTRLEVLDAAGPHGRDGIVLGSVTISPR